MKKKIAMITAFLAVMLSMTGIAVATNFVTNGGFEEPVVLGSWDSYLSILGWTELNGQRMELQRTLWTPYEGNQYLELDAWGSTTIYQDITTVPGNVYRLSFVFSPRPGVADNQLQISWNGNIVDTLSSSGIGKSDTDWTLHTYDLKATSTTTRLQFHNLDVSDTLGTFLDAVTLAPTDTPPPPVPELPTAYLVPIGIIGMFGIMLLKYRRN